MALNRYKLGDLLKLSELRNDNLEYGIDDVKGISIQKVFIETKADMTGVSLRPYYLVKPDYFAYVTVTSRNGEKITLAHNVTDKTYIVSSSYVVFEVLRKDILLSDYLFMYFNRPEFDRYSRFNSWGSARETFSWDDMCDIDILLPSVEIQKKYVDVYNAMLANQQSYERGLEDLKLVCDGYIEDLRRQTPITEIGPFLALSDERNSTYSVTDNKAVSIEKVFVDAHAILTGVDTGNYFVVRTGQFAYNTVTTRNGEKISIAYNKGDSCLVSPIYTVFSITSDALIPEYLMMWFKRSEFDRYSRFHSWGSAREMFTFEDMKKVKIPIPCVEIQRDISDIYDVYMERRTLNDRLKAQIKDLCPILIKGSLEEAAV